MGFSTMESVWAGTSRLSSTLLSNEGLNETLPSFSVLGGEQELTALRLSGRSDCRTLSTAEQPNPSTNTREKRVLLELDQHPDTSYVSLVLNYESHCTSCLNC